MITPTEMLQNPWIAAIAGGITMTSVKFYIDVLISSLEAPTKDSTSRYRYWFKVLNKIAANLARANSTTLENSPNWVDAVEKVKNGKPTP